MNVRKKLSDILHGTSREDLAKQWRETEAAKDLVPLPPGEYVFRILSGEAIESKEKKTPGYKLTLQVSEGEYDGRRCWHDVWLSKDALPMAKRDLGKIGVTDLEQLDRPLPPGILIRAKIALRKIDDGTEHNRVIRFEKVGIEPSDPFAPAANAEGEPHPSDASAPVPNEAAPAPEDGGERQLLTD